MKGLKRILAKRRKKDIEIEPKKQERNLFYVSLIFNGMSDLLWGQIKSFQLAKWHRKQNGTNFPFWKLRMKDVADKSRWNNVTN